MSKNCLNGNRIQPKAVHRDILRDVLLSLTEYQSLERDAKDFLLHSMDQKTEIEDLERLVVSMERRGVRVLLYSLYFNCPLEISRCLDIFSKELSSGDLKIFTDLIYGAALGSRDKLIELSGFLEKFDENDLEMELMISINLECPLYEIISLIKTIINKEDYTQEFRNALLDAIRCRNYVEISRSLILLNWHDLAFALDNKCSMKTTLELLAYLQRRGARISTFSRGMRKLEENGLGILYAGVNYMESSSERMGGSGFYPAEEETKFVLTFDPWTV
ncbi:hypothetical protein ACFL21_04250 [Patescibacteria group bacterium]